ncbi:MAG: hypothetical protein IJ955_08695 [Oscillospiraceae bacterium]|nr:hypothetical protein [Oscillospiraceae bacterium]
MAHGPFNTGCGGQDSVTESQILKDTVTGKHYAMMLENGVPTLLEVSEDLEALDQVRLDTVTGKIYYIGVENGVIVLNPVEEES